MTGLFIPYDRLIDPIRTWDRLGRLRWSAPLPFGPDGCSFAGIPHYTGVVIVSAFDLDDGPWIHASIARPQMPTYEDLQLLHRAVFADGWAYQVFAPPADHVNLHETALHLWGRADGKPALPDFTGGTGMI